MGKRYRIEDVKATIQEIASSNDRASAIVGGSFVDGALDYIITSRLMAVTPGDENALYSVGGPLHSCDQKIKMAHALGLLGPRAKKDLELINEIRNTFAHNMNEMSFAAENIAKKCEAIYAGSEKQSTGDSVSGKDRFVFAIQWYLVFLIEEANDKPDNKLKIVTRHWE